MARNSVAAGVVMVPCVLLGGAFMSTALWTDAAGPNRPLALGISVILVGAGLLAYLLPGSGSTTHQDDPDRDS
ncbi:MAG: GIVxVP protein [Synechococcus sp.]